MKKKAKLKVPPKVKNGFLFLKKLFQLNGYFFMPSSLAFYLIISIIPLISIVAMILSFYSKNSYEAMLSLIQSLNLFPKDMAEKVVIYFQGIQVSDYITLIISIIASIYVASRGIECFSRFSNRFYGINDLDIKFVKRKARSILLTFALILMLSIVVVNFALLSVPFDNVLSEPVRVLLKYLLMAVVLFLSITFIFKVAPQKKEKLKHVLPGSALCTVAISICLFLYSIYLNFSATRMSSIYGPLTSIIILLLIAFLVSYITFMSFYFNILLGELRKDKKVEQENLLNTKEKIVFIDKKQLHIDGIKTYTMNNGNSKNIKEAKNKES